MMMFGERAYAGDCPYNIKAQCRGNSLWLPLWTHFEALCVIEFLNEMRRPSFVIRDLRLLMAVKERA
ncbi:MAG: hypothetical protein DRR19_21330 [Candidatus Parabeggiatoa sp. nov. 1]|nr:MAG: hypothetical protein DRR19_21330 [Gammaproteobacteria bacterium]